MRSPRIDATQLHLVFPEAAAPPPAPYSARRTLSPPQRGSLSRLLCKERAHGVVTQSTTLTRARLVSIVSSPVGPLRQSIPYLNAQTRSDAT